MGPAFPSGLGPGAVWVLCVWVEFVRLAEFRIACVLICGAKVPLFCTPTNPHKKRNVLAEVEPKCIFKITDAVCVLLLFIVLVPQFGAFIDNFTEIIVQ